MRRILTVLVGLYLVAMADHAWSRPLLIAATASNAAVSKQPSPPPGQGSDALNLSKALTLALKHNQNLAAYAQEIRAKDAATLQAGLLPNPELSIEVENFAGQDELQGFDGAETTLALSQLVELGGKRGKRRQLATLEKDLADWDYQAHKLEVLSGTAKAFIQVLAAQQQVAQAGELVHLSEQTLSAVTARVEAGKVPPVELIRAQVELASTRTAASKTRRELEAARRRLAAFWGSTRPEFQRAIGDLQTISQLPPEEEFEGLIKNSPDLARWSTEQKQRQAAVTLARTRALPDLTLSLGIRNSQDSDSNALVAGIEFPLPLFDRNQGAIGEARATQEKSRHERRAAETEARTALAEAWQSLAASHTEATSLRDEILPGAQSAFEAAEFGYREGKFDFLQMIDAQRTLFKVKGQYLQALTTYHLARTEVERLTGAPLHDIQESATNQNHDLR